MLVSCASGAGSLRVARNAETSQNYDLAVAEYTKVLRENPDSREARHGPRARQAARVAGSLHAGRAASRPPASSKKRSSNTSSPRSSTPATPKSIASCRRRARSCAPRSPIREDGKTRLESLIAQSLRRAAAGHGPAGRCQAARVGGVPRRQRARRLLRHRQVHQHQRGVRSDVPRSAGVDRPAQRDPRRRAQSSSRRPRATSGAPPATAASSSCPTRRRSGASTRKRSTAPSI